MATRRTKSDITGIPSFPWFAKAITPHNSNDLQNFANESVPMTVRVGTAGNVRYLPAGNPSDQWVTQAFADGEMIPCVVRKISATSTTATNLVGYF